MQRDERSRLLGEMPMGRLVPKVSVPVMISMIVQALYNVVDSVFVSRYDPDALTAVSLAYPVQMLMIALALGMGTGISSLISRKLGEGRSVEARRAAWNGFLVETLGFVFFAVVGLMLSRPIMGLMVSDNLLGAEKILSLSITYLSIVTIWSFGMFMSVLMERFLQATGNTVMSMVTQLSGAVTNIVLDPIMIFGLLGCPAMGVAGAAIATVIGQFVAALVGFLLNQAKNKELALRLSEFKVDAALLRGIVSVGVPSTVMQAIGSVMNVGMNALLSTFPEGNAAVNVLNVYFKLQSFVFMPVFGLSTGVIAIVGYNYGARNRQRVYSAIRVALIWAGAIMLLGTLLFQLCPAQLMAIFESGDGSEITAQMTALGVTALRVISISFVLAAVGITLSSVFQAVGQGVYSMIMSVCRQLLVLLPAAWLLARIFGTVDAVWWSFTIAELVSLLICLALYRKLRREKLDRLNG